MWKAANHLPRSLSVVSPTLPLGTFSTSPKHANKPFLFETPPSPSCPIRCFPTFHRISQHLFPFSSFSSLRIVARLPQLLRGVSDLPGALLRRQNHAENRGYPSRNRRNARRRGRFERTNRGNRGTQVEEDRQHATVRVKTADIRRILNKYFAAEILASLQSEEFVKLDTLLGLTRSETYPIAVVEYCSIVDRSRESVGFGRESTATAWPFQFCRSLIGWIRCRTGFPAILTSSRIRGFFWR